MRISDWSSDVCSSDLLVAPLIGGSLLGALFCTTIVDSMDPAFGSGSQVDGIGLVFILGMGIIVLGIAIMIAMALTRPAFFRGETLSRGVSAGPEDQALDDRTDERRRGTEWFRPCRPRRSTEPTT